MKITVITGSPRKNGNTFAMVDAFMNVASSIKLHLRKRILLRMLPEFMTMEWGFIPCISAK